MGLLIAWLIQRLGWIYSFVTRDLQLPSFVGYSIIAILIFIFFFDLIHLFRNRHKGNEVLFWLLVILLVPLGTLAYYLIGRRRLEKMIQPVPTGVSRAQIGRFAKANKAIPTTLGTIIGVIAWIAGSVVIVFFVLVAIALIQCANDPKCI